MFSNELWQKSGVSTYSIDQSIRFNAAENAYMHRTPSSTGNRKTFTSSFWVKLGNVQVNTALPTPQVTHGVGSSGLFLNTSGVLQAYTYYSGSWSGLLITNRVFRDPSAWYHFVYIVDSTQAVASERIRIYVNGVRETSFSTESYLAQNQDTDWNLSGEKMWIGRDGSGSGYDGEYYAAEIHFLDGYAYGPEYFGETNNNGIWVPKEYDGSYGTNGFYIDGRDSSDLGDDESGNGNDFTTSGLASHDQVNDSPTNNFCTINPIYRGSSSTAQHYGLVSNGNLFIEHNGAHDGGQLCTQLFESGKWYWEVYIKAGGNSSSYQLGSGIAAVNNGYTKSDGRNEGAQTGEIGFNSYNGVVMFANSTTKTYTEVPFLDTNIIQVAVDADNGAIYYGKNGTFMGSGDPTSGSSKTNAGATWTPASYSGGWVPTTYVGGGSTPEIFINFGQEGTFAGNITAGGNSDANGVGNFKYSVPSGYKALCTKNLGS